MREKLIHVEKNKMVMDCLFVNHLLCHPLWVPDYHNETNNHVTMNTIPDWKNDVHAFHWTWPNPPEFANMTSVLSSEGIFAELGRYVLQKAGIIPPVETV